MKGFSDKYVESIIKRTIKGSMTIRDSAIRLGISRQYIGHRKEKEGGLRFVHERESGSPSRRDGYRRRAKD